MPGHHLKLDLHGLLHEYSGTFADQLRQLVTELCRVFKSVCVHGHDGVLPRWLSGMMSGTDMPPVCKRPNTGFDNTSRDLGTPPGLPVADLNQMTRDLRLPDLTRYRNCGQVWEIAETGE